MIAYSGFKSQTPLLHLSWTTNSAHKFSSNAVVHYYLVYLQYSHPNRPGSYWCFFPCMSHLISSPSEQHYEKTRVQILHNDFLAPTLKNKGTRKMDERALCTSIPIKRIRWWESYARLLSVMLHRGTKEIRPELLRLLLLHVAVIGDFSEAEFTKNLVRHVLVLPGSPS